MQELIQGMGDQHGAVMQYIDSTKGFVDPRSQMAGGGIVSLQQGGPVQKFQQGLSVEGDPLTLDSVTETGERIVALAGPNGVPVTEEEYIAFTENGQLPANRNDRRYSAPTPASPLTAACVVTDLFTRLANTANEDCLSYYLTVFSPYLHSN